MSIKSKNKRAGICVITVLFLVSMGSIANAVPIAGLDWLPFKYTLGLSWNDVQPYLQPGGSLKGWRYATQAEIGSLYTAVHPVWVANEWHTANEGITDAVGSVLGYTTDQSNGFRMIDAIASEPSGGPGFVSNYRLIPSDRYAPPGTDYAGFGATIRKDSNTAYERYVASYLVRDIAPEPPVNNPPVADAGTDQTVELETSEGTEITLDGSGSFDPDGDPLIFEWTWDGGSTDGFNPTVVLPLGTTTITLVVNDGKVDSEPDTVNITVEDTTPPEIEITFPTVELALQDGVAITAVTEDLSGVSEVYFYVREPDDGDGIPFGYEELPAAWNDTMERWELEFDTTELPDGYYVTLAMAVDTHGNEGWCEIVPFSIRNLTASEMLPPSVGNKAGRTIPIKFSLRVAEAVDPAMPFVHNEQLEVKIYDASDPDTVFHKSVYGDTSGDYRINDIEELYITNFKTSKSPAEYVVEIWRLNEVFLMGSFTFETYR